MYQDHAGTIHKLVEFWNQLGEREREGHRSRWQAICEAFYLWARHGIGPKYFLLAGLYRKGLTWEQKSNFMSEAEFLKCSLAINPQKYQYTSLNKVITHALLTTFAIPTPPLYGVINVNHGVAWDGQPLRTLDDLVALTDRAGLREMCFKLIEGLRGIGFYKIRIDTSRKRVTMLPSEDEIALEDFWQKVRGHRMGGYFIQGVVEQHRDVARYNPWSLNTVRALMVKNDDDTWYMHGAALRMGVGKTAVDNMSAGGLGAAIDTSSGRLRAAVQERIDRPTCVKHPVTHVRLEGEVVPYWPEALALCQRVAVVFAYLEVFSCDIAFTVEGPVVLEVGAVFDEPQLYFDEGLRPLMRRLLARRRSRHK